MGRASQMPAKRGPSCSQTLPDSAAALFLRCTYTTVQGSRQYAHKNYACRRYVHYFARALRAWPQKRVVALEAVRMDGLGWLSESNRGTLVLRCRPTGASAAHRVATIHITSGGKALATPWQLEGDIKLEVGTPLYFQLLLFVSYLPRNLHL